MIAENITYQQNVDWDQNKQRKGVLVNPLCRLTEKQMQLIDLTSRELLEDSGLLCYNKQASEIFKTAGARVEDEENCVRVRIPSALIDNALKTAPSKILLGARKPKNRLILDAKEPRVRFGSGAETNVWLDVQFNENKNPMFNRKKGSISKLCKAAHLCEHLENLDFFIRCVNIQDEEVNGENKDINKFLASLGHTSKHVQGGLTDLNQLDNVLELAKIIAGGQKVFEKNPILSFITCIIKSPLQIVDDTTTKLVEIAKRKVPVVISSCPMGGTTGPFDEAGMVSLINAELLAGIALTQLASPGCPVLYGAVPVRTRLDNLKDMYGAPEFVNYNIDCAQMARFYGIPCYSSAGVADTDKPGIQASIEKMMTYMTVPNGGAQYIHYAFGLLERTNTFCPEQAIMDDVHIGIAKKALKKTNINEAKASKVKEAINQVMQTVHKTFMYDLPLPSKENVYTSYPLEDDNDALYAANKTYKEILNKPAIELNVDIVSELLGKVTGILPKTLDVDFTEKSQ